jgi:hypothetical protein
VPTHEGFVYGFIQDLAGHQLIGIRVRVRAGCHSSASVCGTPAPRVITGDTVTGELGYYGIYYQVAMPDPVPDSATVTVVVDGRSAGFALDSARLFLWRPLGSPGAVPPEHVDFQIGGS